MGIVFIDASSSIFVKLYCRETVIMIPRTLNDGKLLRRLNSHMNPLKITFYRENYEIEFSFIGKTQTTTKMRTY